MIHQEKTSAILNCFYKVYNTLGFGFLEKVYENALFHKLTKCGLKCRRQVPITVFYDDEVVGNYFADIQVDDDIIIELKANPRKSAKSAASACHQKCKV